MQQFSFTIQDPMGFHARPAGLLVQLSRELDSKITVTAGGRTIEAGRLIALMGLNVKQGEALLISVEGPHEEDDRQRLEQFFQENL